MKATQRETVLRHLQSGATLTQVEAGRRYEIGRLAARIGELRERGHEITDDRVGNRPSVYRLVQSGAVELFARIQAGRPE